MKRNFPLRPVIAGFGPAGIKEPISSDLEEIVMGDVRIYLNHSNKEVEFSGYDLLKEEKFDHIPAYGVVLLKNDI